MTGTADALHSTYLQRRQRLAALLNERAGDCAAVFASGGYSLRNIPAIHHPFRAGSHMLYFFGPQAPGVFGAVLKDRSLLFVPDHNAEDAVWNGPAASSAALTSQSGVEEVAPLSRFSALISAYPPARRLSIPSTDPGTNLELAKLIGAEPSLTGANRLLAESIVELRLIRDQFELSQLRQAIAATEAGFAAGMKATAAGKREYHIRAASLAAIHERGCIEAFNSAFTVAAEVLHNESTQGELKSGDLLLCDFGAETPLGYSADVTRVWPVSGKFSSTQRDLYQVVLACQQTAIKAAKPGAGYRDIHRKAALTLTEGLVSLGIFSGSAASLVERNAHSLFFPHGLGHLLGLDTHDMGDLGDIAGYAPGRERSSQFGESYLRLDRDLQPGMVVTIEPGFYVIPALLNDEARTKPLQGCLSLERLKQFSDVRGIRIEDDILIADQGAEVLTAAIPKEVSEIESAMRR